MRSGSAVELVSSVWRRRKGLAIVVFLVPFVATVSLVAFMPNVYRATATVLVDRQQVSETMVRSTVTSALETRLHAISHEILSRPRLEGLINRFDLYADLRNRRSMREVLEHMRQDIKLELRSVENKESGSGRGDTVAFALNYQGRDPRTVAKVANTLASFYIEENVKVRERQAAGTADFLKVQLQEVKKRLDQQEARVSQFKRQHLGELPQQLEANLSTIERLNTQLQLNSNSQTRALERRGALAKQLADAASLLPAAGGPDGGAEQLARLNQELRHLRTLYSEKHPDVVRLKAEIAALERDLAADDGKAKANRPAAPVSPYGVHVKQAQADVEGELSVLKGEEKRLRDALGKYMGRVENSPKREQELRELSRDYESTRDYYASLLKRHEEAQLAESLEQRRQGEQFRVLDGAAPPEEPTAPNRLRLLLVGLAGSLGLAIGAVVLAEQLNASFHSMDELRAVTTVPVLLSIPLIVTPEDSTLRRRRLWLVAGAVAVGLVVVIAASFFVAHNNEQLVSLLTRARL